MELEKLRQAINSQTQNSPSLALPRALGEIPAAASPIEAAEEKLGELFKNEPTVRRLVRRAASLADRITEVDRDATLQAIRRALHAHISIYDHHAMQLVKVPDHKTQLAAATLLLAYDEGTPVKRIAAVVQSHTTAAERVEALKQSPEMFKAMRALSGLGVGVEVEGVLIDVETEDVQKSPSEE